MRSFNYCKYLSHSSIIYGNNSDKDSDCETGTDISPSDATSDDPTFEVKVKSKEAVFPFRDIWIKIRLLIF